MVGYIGKFLLLCQLGSVLSSQGILASPVATEDELTLSILADNDLYGDESTRVTHAILVESTQSRAMAPAACTSIGESLWVPTAAKPFNAGLNNTLSHQVYINKYPLTQLFWIGAPGCVAIDYKGVQRQADCHRRLPVLCTNSASVETKATVDSSAPWRVSRKIGKNKQVVTGFRDRDSFKFLGVRFAEDPGRFRHSTPYVYPGTGEVQALTLPPICKQNFNTWILGIEDCLYMNIWTPYLPGKAANIKNLKPVIFWIHGGGLVQGNANEPGYEGSNFASRGDVVFVGIHYRLGNFGWLGIDPETQPDGEGNGNYGLGDMITALQWVKENIKYFGGDASKVTIMGISGGANAVRALMASKKTKGLVAGAIYQSGPAPSMPDMVGSIYPTLESEVEGRGGVIIDGLGCGGLDAAATLTCLRALDDDTIANSASMFWPIRENLYITGDLGVTGPSSGYALKVPMMIGNIRDELAIFAAGMYGSTDVAEIVRGIGPYIFSEDVSAAASHPAFPLPLDAPTPAEAAFNVSSRILSDYGFTCWKWATAYSLAKHNVVPAVYAFSVNRTQQPIEWSPDLCNPPKTAEKPLGDLDAEYYKCHGGDTYTVFGTVKYNLQPDRDGRDYLFSQYSVDLWSSFVRTGNPNPSVGLLKARGFHSTLDRVAQTGAWPKVTANRVSPVVRVIQWEGKNVPWTEQPQCDALGVPVEHYE